MGCSLAREVAYDIKVQNSLDAGEDQAKFNRIDKAIADEYNSLNFAASGPK
jgi:hypothetical protein